jgi:hypothetical protein
MSNNVTSPVVPSTSSSATSADGSSIIPSTGISDLAKLLFVCQKLYSRNLISLEEKRILKQLAIREDSTIMSIDLASESFLTALINTASSIAITAASHTYHELFRHCSTNHGKTLSKNERKTKGITDNSFVYGEIDFHSFSQIIKEIRPLFKPDGIFVDLGSGTGRPVFAMALLSDMKKLIGIESLDGLHEAAKTVLEKYETFVESDEVEVEDTSAANQNEENTGASTTGGSPQRKPKKRVVNSPLAKLERRASQDWTEQRRIELIHGDFLKIDWWSRADFVFMNSTCYSPALISSISNLAEKLRPGTIVVSLTKSLTSKQFTVMSKQKYQMSWGSAVSEKSCTHRVA